ncbi:MAG: T9SS type A sorting domain-containing protein, partial [Bacteroidales bacterium]|nr:T9SS type A sorting domain-containing protein [Bacteroidales bacterium]
AEENIAEAIEVYPNPTSSMVTIANAEGKDIIVVNSLGQVVASIENAAANQTIDVSNFANGTYFVKVDAEVVKLNVVK